MKFYEMPDSIKSVMNDRRVRVYPIVEFELGDEILTAKSEIILCETTSMTEAAGGTVNGGTLVLDNTGGKFTHEKDARLTPGTPLAVSYCFGSDDRKFMRFSLYVGDEGFQATSDGADGESCTVRLTDLSARLKKANDQRDWTGAQTAINCKVCDAENERQSLVHIIAARAGLGKSDIKCGKLDYTIPYCTITQSAWVELSELARIYNAHMECGKDFPLVFNIDDDDASTSDGDIYTLNADSITHVRRFDSNADYANSIRLKYTRHAQTEKRELWKFSGQPTWLDEDLGVYFPFTGTRDIETTCEEAEYKVRTDDGKTLPVVYADEIDTKEEFEARIVTRNGARLTVERYDTTTSKDRAYLKVTAAAGGALLKSMCIHGRAITAEKNQAIYIRDDKEIERNGLAVKNVTSKFLSETEVGGKPFTQAYAERLLVHHKKIRTGYFVKTNTALVGARAGATIRINLREEKSCETCRITRLTLRYKNDVAFESALWLMTT